MTYAGLVVRLLHMDVLIVELACGVCLLQMFKHTTMRLDDCRYGKAGADPKKPLGTRVDLKSFFDQYGVKAFSTFKKKFCTEELRPIGPGGVPMSKPKV